MIDSSVKNLGEVEYDNQILYNIKKPKFGREIQSEGYPLLQLYINRSITKMFPIKTLSDMIDSDRGDHWL